VGGPPGGGVAKGWVRRGEGGAGFVGWNEFYVLCITFVSGAIA